MGDTVIKYGVDIGKVVQPITQGRSTRTSTTSRPSGGEGVADAWTRTIMQDTFWGYRRENGRVGVRNHVIILPVDDLSNAACEAVANNIKGTMAIPHPYGRLQFGADLELHFRTLIGTGCNPNVAAVVVIGIEEQLDQAGRRRHRGDRQAGAPASASSCTATTTRSCARRRPRASTCSGRARSSARNARSTSSGCRPSAANRTRRPAAARTRPSATRSTSSTRRAARWSSARRPS